MGLRKMTDRIYYVPHQPEFDRPMLAYVKGSKFSLAIDAGFSDDHVDGFYGLLESNGFKEPDFTAITHWHYDHTFGMHHIKGASIAHHETNRFLRQQQVKAADMNYLDMLKSQDIHFDKEYRNKNSLHIVLSDIEFQDKVVLDLGGLTADIFHTESPHSEDAVCIHIPEEKVLFLGDSTSEDYFNDSYMDKSKLQRLVDMIKDTDCAHCILSHSEPLTKEELLEYLSHVLEA